MKNILFILFLTVLAQFSFAAEQAAAAQVIFEQGTAVMVVHSETFLDFNGRDGFVCSYANGRYDVLFNEIMLNLPAADLQRARGSYVQVDSSGLKRLEPYDGLVSIIVGHNPEKRTYTVRKPGGGLISFPQNHLSTYLPSEEDEQL